MWLQRGWFAVSPITPNLRAGLGFLAALYLGALAWGVSAMSSTEIIALCLLVLVSLTVATAPRLPSRTTTFILAALCLLGMAILLAFSVSGLKAPGPVHWSSQALRALHAVALAVALWRLSQSIKAVVPRSDQSTTTTP